MDTYRNIIAMVRRMNFVIELCKDTPMCPSDLAKKTVLSVNTIRSYLESLHKDGQIHIALWASIVSINPETGKKYTQITPFYKAGDLPDAQKPVIKKHELSMKNSARLKKLREDKKNGLVPIRRIEPAKEEVSVPFKKQSWLSQLYAA